jgi:hypothetical protein
MVPLNQLVENDYNPRKFFDDAAMQELVDSIQQVGLIQPPAARPSPKIDDKLEVIVGIRRLKAMRKIYGAESTQPIPCHVINVDDAEAQILSVTENVARQNLLPSEEAHAYGRYFFGTLKIERSFDLSIPDVRIRKKVDPKALTAEEYAHKVGTNVVTLRSRLHINAMEVLYRQPITAGGAFAAKYLVAKFGKFHVPRARSVKDAVSPHLAGETLIPVDLHEIAPDARANARAHKGRGLYSVFGTPIRRDVIENDADRIEKLLPYLLNPLPVQDPNKYKDEYLCKDAIGIKCLQPLVVFRRCDGTTITEERPDIRGCQVTKRGN